MPPLQAGCGSHLEPTSGASAARALRGSAFSDSPHGFSYGNHRAAKRSWVRDSGFGPLQEADCKLSDRTWKRDQQVLTACPCVHDPNAQRQSGYLSVRGRKSRYTSNAADHASYELVLAIFVLAWEVPHTDYSVSVSTAFMLNSTTRSTQVRYGRPVR